MNHTPIYLDSYVIQSDMRIRVPKSAIANRHAIPGKTRVSSYYDPDSQFIILRVCDHDCSGAESDTNEVKSNG